MSEASLDTTKKILRSILNTVKNGLSVNELQKQYRELEGRYIPYQQLGYNNIRSFLGAIPDTVYIRNYGTEFRVFPVLTESSKHIHALVTEQRPSKNSKSSKKKPIPPFPFRYGFNQPMPYYANNNLNQVYWPPNYSSHQVYNSAQSNVEQQLALLQIAQHPLLQLVQFLYNYSKFATTINAELLSNLYDSHHMYQNYQHARAPMPNVSFTSFTPNTYPVKSNNYTNGGTSFGRTEYKPQRSTEQNNNSIGATSNKCQENETKMENTTQIQIETNACEKVSESQSVVPTVDSNETAIKIAPKKGSIRWRLEQRARMCTSDNNMIDSSTQETAGEEILQTDDILHESNTTDNCTDAIKPLDAIEETEYLSKWDDSDERVNLSRENSLRSGCISNESNDLVSLKQSPTFDTLPSDFESLSIDLTHSKCGTSMDVLVDKVSNAAELEEMTVSNMTVNSYSLIEVVQINSPYKFWFQTYEQCEKMEKFMESIQCFYKGKSSWMMPLSEMQPQELCVAKFNEIWHRAKILELPNDDKVKVLLIDYYVDVDIEVHKIRYLARQFSDLPIQAIRACLSDLKPISGEWTTESAIAFTAMVKEKFLYAKIKAVDVKKNMVAVTLIDTNTEDDIYINQQLVAQGHALFVRTNC